MKVLQLKQNYFWNEFFDFIFLPVSYPKRIKEIIFRPGSKRYQELSKKPGWKKIGDQL